MTDDSAPSRTDRQSYSAIDVEAVYLTYAAMSAPSVAKAAELHGISPRTAERWAYEGKWKERRARDEVERVAALRIQADRRLAHRYGELLDNLAGLAVGAESESVRYQATVHALGIMGTDRTQRSMSVVQHLRDSAPKVGDARTVEQLRDELHAALLGLGDGDHPSRSQSGCAPR